MQSLALKSSKAHCKFRFTINECIICYKLPLIVLLAFTGGPTTSPAAHSTTTGIEYCVGKPRRCVILPNESAKVP